METAIILLLLALSEKNESVKESLHQFLSFYKENRELIQTLSGAFDGNKKTETSREEHEESRPREEVGNPSILEEYLRRVNA